MAIRVEFIKRRAGGRITARPTVYEKNEVTLGRGSDCDVHMPDLRVGLRHARLIHLSANKVRIEASEDHRIRINQSLTRRRDIAIEDNPEIRIGPYLLTLKRGETKGDLLVWIELVDAPTAIGDSGDEAKIFSMKGHAPGKRASAWVFLGLILTAFLALPVIAHLRPASPEPDAQGSMLELSALANQPWLAGDMSSAHANLVSDCRTCHIKPFTRVLDKVCLACHSTVQDHTHPSLLIAAAPEKARHEKWLIEVRSKLSIPEGRCGSCHFEHDGPHGVTPASSAMCSECHRDMDRRLPETTLLNVRTFTGYHPEFKPTIVVSPDRDKPQFERISLLDKPAENNGLKFPHDFHLNNEEVARKIETLGPAARQRFGAELDCGDCHRANAAGALFSPIEMERHCGDCHSLAFSADESGNTRLLPHGEPAEVRRTLNDFYLAQATALLLGDQQSDILRRPLSAEARARRTRLREQAFADARNSTNAMIDRIFSEDGACQKCHTVETAASEAGGAPRIAPVLLMDRFLPKARFSHAQHMTGNIDCASCHNAETSSQSSDVLLPGIATCRDCHSDVGARMAIASNCLTCHGYHDEDTALPMTPARLRVTMEGGPKQ